MTENNYGQTRWSANQTGKCSGASPSFIHTWFHNITKTLFCSQSNPEITIVFTSSYAILCWQQWIPICFKFSNPVISHQGFGAEFFMLITIQGQCECLLVHISSKCAQQYCSHFLASDLLPAAQTLNFKSLIFL